MRLDLVLLVALPLVAIWLRLAIVILLFVARFPALSRFGRGISSLLFTHSAVRFLHTCGVRFI